MRVDFYILQNEYSRELMACRLSEKAYSNGNRIYLHTDSPQYTRQIDEMLWTFRQGSFLPHELYTSNTDLDSCPIIIGHGTLPDASFDLLLNLSSEVPDFYQQFPRIAEIINQTPEIKAPGRKRYSFYRDQGCDLHTHELSL